MTGTFALGTVTTDAGGRPVSTYGSFAVQNTATGANLVWTPIPGFPIYNDPVVTITSPASQPVSVIDADHELRVTATSDSGPSAPILWSMVSGPEAVSFENPAAATTRVRFTEAGTYILRCTASNAGGSGSRDLTVEVAPVATEISLREGVEGVVAPATFIRGDTTTWNSGARDQIIVGRNPGIFRSLLTFPVSAIPANSFITEATLDLTICAAGSGSNLEPMNIHPLNVPFDEGTGDGLTASNGASTGADWQRRTYSPATSWTTAGTGSGTDYGAQILGTSEAFDPLTTPAGTVIPFTATQAFAATVASRIAAASPVHLLVKGATDTTAASGFARIASEDYPTVDWRPRLNVSYHDHLAPIIDPGQAPAATVGTPVVLTGAITHGTGLGWTSVSGPGQVFITNPTPTGATMVFTHPGSHLLRFTGTNAHGESSRLLEIVTTGTAMTEQEIWRMQHFGSAVDNDTADSNNDGENNLLEFATGQNPFAATRMSPTVTRNGANLEFTYTRSKAAVLDGITFIVEWSANLSTASWNVAGSGEVVISDDGKVQTVRTSMPAGTPRIFLRLRVSR